MKQIWTINIIFLSLLLSVFCVNCEARMGTSPNADFLVEIAQRHFERGRYETAIHEFQKALLINPDHPVALEYLNKMNIGIGGPSTDRTHRAEVAKLGRIIYKQKGQIEYLKDLKDENQKLRSYNKKMANKSQGYINETNQLNREINMLHRDLSHVKKQQLAEINNIANYYKDQIALRDTEYQHPDTEELEARYYQSLQTAMLHADEALTLSKENAKMKNYFNEHYAHQDKIIRVLEEYVDMHEELFRQMQDELTLAKVNEAKSELKQMMLNAEALGVNQEHKARLDMLNQKINELGIITRN